MKNLVVVMAGDQSLHESYATDRDYDLWVYHWGTDPQVAERYARTCDRIVRRTGKKWELARNLGTIREGIGDPPYNEYGYVALMDDDVRFQGGSTDLSRAFELARDIRADIFQPAITNEFASSKVQRQVDGVICRAVTTAEIMIPAYSGDIFRLVLLPLLHAIRLIRAGWGLESLIATFAEATLGRPVRTFILDEIGAIHTRPVSRGSPLHELGRDEWFLLSMFINLPGKEIARFRSQSEAARFEFSFLHEPDAEAELRMKQLRSTRLLHDIIRKRKGWRRRMLPYLFPELEL